MSTEPSLVSLDAIRHARAVIGTRLHRTPVVASRTLSERCGGRVLLKCELFQKTGSFKPRGVLNALATLTPGQRARGVVSLSAGNHAQALAWGAATLGVPSLIVMPATAVPSKIAATRGYGGEVVTTDQDLLATARTLQEERGLTLVHPFDDPRIIAGQGTVGLELVEDVPDVATVLVGCGGGGLLSGVAAAVRALRPGARVVAVEPEGAAGMHRSLAQNAPARLTSTATVADGLAAPFIGALTFAHARRLVHDVLLVDDAQILNAMRFLMERAKLMAEPAGAAALAPLLSGRLDAADRGPTVVIVSGGNTDLTRLKALL